MLLEPGGCEVRDLLQGAGFFEQVRGVWHDRQFPRTRQLLHRVAIQREDICVSFAHDEQRWCADVGQRRCGKIRTAAP